MKSSSENELPPDLLRPADVHAEAVPYALMPAVLLSEKFVVFLLRFM